MNHTFVLLCAGFIAAIKVFINLQTAASTSKASFRWICLCVEGLRFGPGCQVTCCLWSLRFESQSASCPRSFWSPRRDKEEEAKYELLSSCLVAFLLIASYRQTFVNTCTVCQEVRAVAKPQKSRSAYVFLMVWWTQENTDWVQIDSLIHFLLFSRGFYVEYYTVLRSVTTFYVA